MKRYLVCATLLGIPGFSYATGTFDAVTAAAATGMADTSTSIVSVGASVALAVIALAGVGLIIRAFHAR